MRNGMVVLVGAGPGDPGLITVKGLSCLKACDAVVYDSLSSEQLLAAARPDCRKVYVGKRAGRHSMKQEEINRLLVELGKEGLYVVRLKGGDPFVFGRGGEEALALAAEGIPYEIIPGVTSAVAVPECAGIPVTHRSLSRSFHVITGHTKGAEGGLPPEFGQVAALPGTLVFLMGLNSLPAIVEGLLKAGRPQSLPAAVIENGTLENARTVRGCLGDIQGKVLEAGLHTPAIIVAGEAAALDLSCKSGLPLGGVRVGITGTASFRERLGTLLDSLGAKVECAGAMEVNSHADSPEMEAAYGRLSRYEVIVFTSANGVRLFFDGLLKSGRDFRALGQVKFAVVGPGTAGELLKYGFRADYMPRVYRTRELAELLAQVCQNEGGGIKPTAREGMLPRILIPRSRGGSPELTEILSRAGVAFDDIVLYDVTGGLPVQDAAGPQTGCDYITFASASGVEAYFEQMGGEAMERLAGIRTVCIGDVTAGALESHGRRVDVLAKEFTVRGMAEAILNDRSEGDERR